MRRKFRYIDPGLLEGRKQEDESPVPQGSSSLSGTREKARQQIVFLVFVVYGLLITQGALRKWIFPGMSNYLFFIRDPFVFYIYFLAARNKFWPKGKPIVDFGMKLAVAGVALAVLQYLFVNEASLIAFVFGWRMWFLYLPLVFIIGDTLNKQDLKRLAGFTLLVSIPMALLVYRQITSPWDSFINRTAEEGVFYGDAGARGSSLTRTTGTFTFFHGYQVYLGSIIAFCMASWILPKKERPLARLLMTAAFIATGISFALDITRTPTFLAGLIVCGAFLSSFYIKDFKKRNRARIVLVGLLVLGALIVFRYFSSVHETRAGRFDEDYLRDRAHGMFTDFVPVVTRVSLLGGGLGGTSRGGRVLGAPRVKYSSESEWRNLIAEGGIIFGPLFLFYRVWMVWWLFTGAIKAVKRSDDPLPLILIAFTAPIFGIWYITTIGSVHGYGFMFAGFCAAANRLGEGPVGEAKG